MKKASNDVASTISTHHDLDGHDIGGHDPGDHDPDRAAVDFVSPPIDRALTGPDTLRIVRRLNRKRPRDVSA
jgi:hypothetical protein